MAGIIDGEGCVYVNRRKASGRRKTPGYSVKVCVNITSKEIVNWFRENMELTSVFERHPPGNRKVAWLCTWNNTVAQTLLKQILPYSIIKKKQIELGIQLLDHLKKSKRGGPGNITSDDDIAFREKIKTEISLLNKRGKY